MSTLLTKREEEIKALLLKGMTNKNIANHLHITPETVRNSISRMMLKLNVTNRTQLVIKLMD